MAIAIYSFILIFKKNSLLDNFMTLYDHTLASHSFRFKRLMLAYSNTEIEQTLRDARLLFEKLDRVLAEPTEATEAYRLKIEALAEVYKQQGDIQDLKTEVEDMYAKLIQLI